MRKTCLGILEVSTDCQRTPTSCSTTYCANFMREKQKESGGERKEKKKRRSKQTRRGLLGEGKQNELGQAMLLDIKGAHHQTNVMGCQGRKPQFCLTRPPVSSVSAFKWPMKCSDVAPGCMKNTRIQAARPGSARQAAQANRNPSSRHAQSFSRA